MISDITIDRKNGLVCFTLEGQESYANLSFEQCLEIAKEITAPCKKVD